MERTHEASPFIFSDWAVAVLFAVLAEGAIFGLLLVAGKSGALEAREDPVKPEIPIEILPVLDDAPLLKLGSKRRENQLPDMWRKPKPQKRYEDKSAPAANAEKTLDKPLDNELAKPDETAAPEDAELAKQVDEEIPEEEKPEDANLPQEGGEDGLKEGTESDPLKALVVSQYRVKLQAWFRAGFVYPTTGEIPLEELCRLRTLINVTVGSDRSVAQYALTAPSGNAIFDARVRAHMDRKVGQQLPPPPPNYPDILEKILSTNFSGKTDKCKNISSNQSGAGTQPEAPAREEPPSEE